MQPILISPAQLRACQVLRAEVERLITFYQQQAADCTREAEARKGSEWSHGFLSGRAQGYQMAAEFLQKALTEADK